MEVKTPFDDTQAEINGISLRDAYLLGKDAGMKGKVAEIEQAKKDERELVSFEILEWFRRYARQLELKYPNPTVEEQGWMGNIWDMIKMAGKEDWQALKGEK